MKDFDSWNQKKKEIQQSLQPRLSFKEREVWWCYIGLNIGDEEDGKNHLFERPVLIIKKFNTRICWVLPLTSKVKTGGYYHLVEYQGKTFSIILSQLRLVSTKRFRRRIRSVSQGQFRAIKHKILNLIT